ncbi:MAG: hypothetical protein SGPRY_004802, partial [Prymnesium sp.]
MSASERLTCERAARGGGEHKKAAVQLVALFTAPHRRSIAWGSGSSRREDASKTEQSVKQSIPSLPFPASERLSFLLRPSEFSHADLIGIGRQTLSRLRSLACSVASHKAHRLGAVRALGSWLLVSHMGKGPPDLRAHREKGIVPFALRSLLGVCHVSEEEELCEEAARAIASLARLPSLSPLLLDLGCAHTLLQLLKSMDSERGDPLLICIFDGLCRLSDAP